MSETDKNINRAFAAIERLKISVKWVGTDQYPAWHVHREGMRYSILRADLISAVIDVAEMDSE